MDRREVITETRTLDAIIAAYALEPTLADIFVEGETDARFLDYAFEQLDISANAIPIDLVHIPPNLLNADQRRNNRERVLVLARTLESEFPTQLPRVACLIDSDADKVLRIHHPERLVVSTDFTDLAMYCYDRKHLLRSARMSTRITEARFNAVLDQCESVARWLYAVAASNKKLDWRMPRLTADRYVRVTATTVSLDRGRYLRAYLMSGNRLGDQAQFESVLGRLEQKLGRVRDMRHAARSHDLFYLIARYFHRQYQHATTLGTERGIIDLLRLSCSIKKIARTRLLSRLSTYAN